MLGPRLGLSAEVIYRESGYGTDEDDPDDEAYAVSNGVAVISIYGVLVKRAGGMQAQSGMTSYEELAGQIASASMDPAVQTIVFDVDSPGGEAAGMSDLSDLIFSLRGQKPMIAVSNDDCYSAAYGIASAADQVYVTRDGGVGSIGCYMLHCDRSGANKQAGLNYTYVYAGAEKISANPMAPLSAAALDQLQNEVRPLPRYVRFAGGAQPKCYAATDSRHASQMLLRRAGVAAVG